MAFAYCQHYFMFLFIFLFNSSSIYCITDNCLNCRVFWINIFIHLNFMWIHIFHRSHIMLTDFISHFHVKRNKADLFYLRDKRMPPLPPYIKAETRALIIRIVIWNLLLFSVVVDETAFQDNIPFVICQLS